MITQWSGGSPTRRAVVAILLASALAQGVASAQPLSAPTAVADQTSVSEGTFVRVSGSGWSDAAPGLVSVQVCGNAGIDSSADCDLAGTAVGGVRDSGVFYTGIAIHQPPRPCPCVLRVYTVAGSTEVLIPIEIQGMSTATPSPAMGTVRQVTVTDVSVERADAWSSWFGAAPARTLVFSVTNTGDVLLHHPRVTLTWGRGSSPVGFMRPPDLGDLAPGQTTVSRMDIPMGAFSLGTYRVTLRVDPIGGEPATAFAATSVHPWGLILAGAVAVQLSLLWLRNRCRRKHFQPPSPPFDSSPSSGRAPSEEVPVSTAPVPTAGSTSRSTRFSRRRSAGNALGAVLLAALVAGCGSSKPGASTTETIQPDPNCPLSIDAAQELLPADAVAVEPPPVGTAVDAPTTRCQFSSGRSSLQLSVFAGSEMLAQLKGILAKATPAPEVSEGAYSEAHQGVTDAVVSCIFVARGSTYVLALNVPNDSFQQTLEPQLRELAAVLANAI